MRGCGKEKSLARRTRQDRTEEGGGAGEKGKSLGVLARFFFLFFLFHTQPPLIPSTVTYILYISNEADLLPFLFFFLLLSSSLPKPFYVVSNVCLIHSVER